MFVHVKRHTQAHLSFALGKKR